MKEISRREVLRGFMGLGIKAFLPEFVIGREEQGLKELSFRVFGRGYKVEPGDTLVSIASAQGVKIAPIINLNGIEKPDQIFVGQELILPANPEIQATGILIDNQLFSMIQTRQWLGQGWERENSYQEQFWQHPNFPRALFVHRNTWLGEEMVKRINVGTGLEIFAGWNHQEPVLTGKICQKLVLSRKRLDDFRDPNLRQLAFDPKLLGLITCHPENVSHPQKRLFYLAVLSLN